MLETVWKTIKSPTELVATTQLAVTEQRLCNLISLYNLNVLCQGSDLRRTGIGGKRNLTHKTLSVALSVPGKDFRGPRVDFLDSKGTFWASLGGPLGILG